MGDDGANVLAMLRQYWINTQYMATLDKIGNKILHELSADGRVTNSELAARVGLSPSACLRRVQELERSGVITGYRAVLNRAALGIGFTAYIAVGLSNHTKEAQRAFERSIVQSPEVQECHNITGVFEYLLRVETTDLAAYKVFHTDVLGTLAQVSSITTYVVMDSVKDERA
jgi:DNA-binding Lrp family transcriptional regulator